MSSKTFGLALSGGGARGIYHIGVLKALEEKGIHPDCISGTSAGALIGVLYASGLSADEIYHIASGTKWFKFLKPSIPSGGLIGMDYLSEILNAYLPVDSFEALRIPCWVTACNITKGVLEIFNKGPVVKPVLASCSVPMLFRPVNINDDFYLDGGILMNLPASIIRKDCKVLMGVSLTPILKLPNQQLNSSMKILTRVLELNVNNNSIRQKEICDVLIESEEIAGISKYHLGDYELLYKLGYESAISNIEKNPVLLQLI
ncbi:MAG: patatin-like phospholipase family protein [Saprospiraceae bacterium]|nr:patatin-like phospholipase family protein [Saprospiraceae bacterium]